MQTGLTPAEADLFRACREGDEAAYERLVQDGVNPSARNALGVTSLHMAAESSCASLAKRLVSLIRVDEASLIGSTALHLCAEKGTPEVMRVLLAPADAKVDVLDESGRTPLSLACERGDLGMANELLAHGASPDVVANGSGMTPFLEAVKSGNLDLVERLAQEADMGVRNARGRNALHLAVIAKHEEIARLLVQDDEMREEQDEMGKVPRDYAQQGSMRSMFEAPLPPVEPPQEPSMAPDGAADEAEQLQRTSLAQATDSVYQMQIFSDEILDLQGTDAAKAGNLQALANKFLLAAGDRISDVTQSISCVSIPSTNKSPGRIVRTLSIMYKINK